MLSGFVISWAAERDGTARNYILNRASRIYSVALPALALTWLTDSYLLMYYPGVLGAPYQYAAPWKYLPVFLTFTNDFWFLSEDAFSNVPYWSLCYEVWYYVVFGALVFGRGFWRWGIAIASLLTMGPRLWLLWPIWLAGAYLYRLPPLTRRNSRALLFLCLAGVIVLKQSGFERALNDFGNDVTAGFAEMYLRYSQFFLGDYVATFFIVGAIHAARGSRSEITCSNAEAARRRGFGQFQHVSDSLPAIRLLWRHISTADFDDWYVDHVRHHRFWHHVRAQSDAA